MQEGEKLKKYIETHGIDVTDLANKTGFHRTTIYSHYKKEELKRAVKIKYIEALTANPFNEPHKPNNQAGNTSFTAPRLEAIPLRLASDPNDYDNDGSQYEELPDGTIRMRVPLIPHKAFAGYLRGFQDREFYEELPYISIDVTKQHKGHYLAFEVKGDSMTTLEPENFRKSIFDGVKVVGRELAKHHWKYKLHINSTDAWVIVHKTEGILIKQIIDHDVEEGIITIHSLNPDKNEYPDQDLHLNDVEQIFNVVKKIDE